MIVHIVEDTAVQQLLLRAHITKIYPNCSCVISEDGEEALKDLDKMESLGLVPEVILLDLKMPNMGGLEFLDILRKRGNSIPIVLQTSLEELCEEEQRKYANYPMLKKPFTLKDLEEIMRSIY